MHKILDSYFPWTIGIPILWIATGALYAVMIRTLGWQAIQPSSWFGWVLVVISPMFLLTTTVLMVIFMVLDYRGK